MNVAKTTPIFVTFILFLLGVNLFFSFFYSSFSDNFAIENKTDCVDKIEDRVVRGNSLSGLVENGQTVKILFGFYNCNKIQKGDMVAYNYAGNPEPIIKVVKGIHGDKFELKKSDAGWHILINNQIIKNSEGKPYLISGNKYKMLSLYERDYKGVIPENTYLILGNIPVGTSDSSRFGLIDKSDIFGKVIFSKEVSLRKSDFLSYSSIQIGLLNWTEYTDTNMVCALTIDD